MDALSVRVECPSCQKRLRVPVSAVGKKVRCPGCGSAVAVPAAGGDAPAGVVVLAVPPPPEPRPAADAFDFDAALPPAPDAPATEPDAREPEESDVCVLCGECEGERQFFLSTRHAQAQGAGTLVTWMNFPARCCERCFGTVSGLQTAVTVLTYASLAVIALAVAALVLWGNKKIPAYVIGVAVVPLVAVIVGACVVWWQRRRLIARRSLIPTLKRARAAFFKTTKLRDVTFVPLATVKGDSLDLQR